LRVEPNQTEVIDATCLNQEDFVHFPARTDAVDSGKEIKRMSSRGCVQGALNEQVI